MATEYTIRYRFTDQDNTSGERSVAFSKFIATGDTDKQIGQITSITYVHYHTSDKPMTWNLRGRLMFGDGTYLVSNEVANSISGNVVKYSNTFTDLPTDKQFASLSYVQTLDSSGKTTAGGYYAKLYWRANDTYPMELIVTFLEEPPVTYAPKIDTFSLQRCDSNGTPDDEGGYIATTMKISIGDSSGLNDAQLRVYYSANEYPEVGVSQYIDLTSNISGLLSGAINDSSILSGTWSASASWYFVAIFLAGEETSIATASISRGSCSFHISDYPGGGACVGGFSSGTTVSPKFESYAPGYFYGGIYGVNIYTIGETNTNGKWIDGKPIYRYVLKTTSTVDGGSGTVGHLPEDIDTLIYANGTLRDSVGSGNRRTLPFVYYGSSNWSVSYYIKDNGEIVLQAGSEYNGTKEIIIVVEYTKTTDEATNVIWTKAQTRPLAAMSSNNSQGCVVSASSQYSSDYAPYRAFNKSADSNGWASKETSDEKWIQLQMDVALKDIVVTIYNRTRSSSVNGPTTGTIHGSNDGSTWYQIGSFANRDGSTSGASSVHTCTNTDTAYKYVKLIVSNPAQPNVYIGIGEIYIDGNEIL